MSTAARFSSRKWRRMAMALQPQQLSSSMVTPGANRGREGHRQHLGGGQGLRAGTPQSRAPVTPSGTPSHGPALPGSLRSPGGPCQAVSPASWAAADL